MKTVAEPGQHLEQNRGRRPAIDCGRGIDFDEHGRPVALDQFERTPDDPELGPLHIDLDERDRRAGVGGN